MATSEATSKPALSPTANILPLSKLSKLLVHVFEFWSGDYSFQLLERPTGTGTAAGEGTSEAGDGGTVTTAGGLNDVANGASTATVAGKQATTPAAAAPSSSKRASANSGSAVAGAASAGASAEQHLRLASVPSHSSRIYSLRTLADPSAGAPLAQPWPSPSPALARSAVRWILLLVWQ